MTLSTKLYFLDIMVLHNSLLKFISRSCEKDMYRINNIRKEKLECQKHEYSIEGVSTI